MRLFVPWPRSCGDARSVPTAKRLEAQSVFVSYDIFRHRHNFSVWAAARATQRRFTTVDRLRDALQGSGIVEFVRDHALSDINADTFLTHHGKWCDRIVELLKGAGVQRVTFGRAAKLVAVYIKSMVVVGPHAQTNLARVAHPPIDRILLKNLSRLETLPRDTRKVLRVTNWTDLDRDCYYALSRLLQGSVPNLDPFWHLEEYWTVTQDADD